MQRRRRLRLLGFQALDEARLKPRTSLDVSAMTSAVRAPVYRAILPRDAGTKRAQPPRSPSGVEQLNPEPARRQHEHVIGGIALVDQHGPAGSDRRSR